MNFVLRHVGTLGWNRVLVILVFMWLAILLFTILPMLTTHVAPPVDTQTMEKLARAVSDLEALRKQNLELQQILQGINLSDLKSDQKEALENFQNRLSKAEHSVFNEELGFVAEKQDPSTQYEILRRRIRTNVKELWYFITSEVETIRKQSGDLPPETLKSLAHILNLGVQHKRSLIHDIDRIEKVDGYGSWRETEAESLSTLVQDRFRFLQNPEDCSKAKKIVCSLNKGCGYGCQLHHVVYCFMVAYGTKRTLILKSKGWRYHKGGWEDIFKPISETCTDPGGETVSNWPGNTDTQVLTLPIIDSLSPRPPFLPLAIPEDLAPRLMRLHGDPIVWWVGQFLKYLLRPQEKTTALIQNTMASLGFKRPIVGVHIRRTDKVGTEASYHSVEEYMNAVEEYYNQLELREKVDKRRVYLATDDPKVIADAKRRCPKYEILADPAVSKTAAVSSRYSDTSLQGIILDIHMLSMSDYLVCTFSSQVCRVAYEIMQNYFPDASDKFKSLDDIYYYGGQSAHNRVAVLPHEAQKVGEISLLPGDTVGIAGNHWNGYSKGRSHRTNQVGLFPSFKVKDKVEIAKFPTYSEMHKSEDS